MISNNSTSYKHKASKNHDYDYNQSDYDNSSIDGDLGDSNLYQPYGRDGRGRGSGRGRSEFRPTGRINDRRGGFRGRGGNSSRRGDRDFSDNFFQVRKYDSRNSETVGNYNRGKVYEPEKKLDFKYSLPEDTRISKLLRRLNNEQDQETSLAISKKLLEVLLLPENGLYVRKAFHILGESVFEIFKNAPGPLAKQQAARVLGRMGYIMGQQNDFDRYQRWLFPKMNNSFEYLQILLMKSFKETLELEIKNPVLETHAKSLINLLVEAIESTENAEIFKSILDSLIGVVEIYPADFYEQFRDTVDLLFGWHVDHAQPLANIEFISKNLQRISQHFIANIDFSVSLIENFLEDITNYFVQNAENDPACIEHVTCLILALNTVLKCLGFSYQPATNKYITAELVTKCFVRVVETITEFLDKFAPDNLTIAANDCISILLGAIEKKTLAISNMVYKLLEIELALLEDFADATVISVLLLISKIIKELSTNLPIELIEKLIGPESKIVKLRYSQFKDIQESVIYVYQSLLNVKNVSLLQETYRYVLGDLEVVYKNIIPNIEGITQNNPFVDTKVEDPELTMLFLLRCLSQLANASSIIVMWALKPTILELVGQKLQPYNSVLTNRTPALQYSMLYLLYSHCKCYNHFISNSTLVNTKKDITNRFSLTEELNFNDVPNVSPNSGNFAIILDILYKSLKGNRSSEVSLLLLQWLQDILNNSENYLENLYDIEQFTLITEVLVKTGYSFNTKIVKAVCENLEKLLNNKQLSWSNTFLKNVCDLCKLHMNSSDESVRNCYTKLVSNTPWDISIIELNKINMISNKNKKKTSTKDYNNYMVHMAQHIHLSGSVTGDMYQLHFKKFMNYLLKNELTEEHLLEDVFICCWTPTMNTDLFYDLTLNSRQVLNNWNTLESAQFCINQKLRTPLGKPNETFTKIESALNQLGNDLISVKKSGKNNALQTDSMRVRMLLLFIENLEKCIYKAYEGSAMPMFQVLKAVRSFFIANSNTCNEWLSRIRMVVMHIALHSGDANIALRNGQCLIKDLVNAGKTRSPEFEKVLIFVTLALLNLRESEALYGLYKWCKQVVENRFGFIKCASDQALKKYEIAIEGYKRLLEEYDENKNLDSETHNFICDQITVCYKELNNMNELMVWHDQRSEHIENGRKYWFNTTDWDCNKCLSNLDFSAQAFNDLSSWSYKEDNNYWSVYESLSATESNLYNIALNLASQTNVEDLNVKIENNLTLIQKNIQEHLNSAPSEFLQNFSLLMYVAKGLKHVANNTNANTVFLVSENFEDQIDKIDSSVLRKILWWSEYFGTVQNQGFNIFCSNLRLDVIKRARKERNFKLAFHNIFKFFKDKDIIVDKDKDDIATNFMQNIHEITQWNVDTAKATLETIKLSYYTDKNKQNTFNLCATASTAISKYAEMCGSTELRKLSSQILLKLAYWLQVNETISLTEIKSPLSKLLMVLPEIGMMENIAANIIPLNEMAVGKLLQFSAHHCVSLAKSWNDFGTWCYRWGKKIVDNTRDVKNNLSEEQCKAIRNMLPVDTKEEDLNKIFVILSQTRSIIDEEDIDCNEISTSEMIQSQLQGVSVLRNATEEQLQALVQFWRSTQKRIYAYFALSADSYFRYLDLALNSENINRNTECSTISVTLRLLRLIVKFALELQNILEEGLQTTPTQPWKVIIPQLFSRLNHPEGYVRHRVADLLCRVAEDAPHLITFPAVVGALEGGVKFDFSEITLSKDCLSQRDEGNDENELNEDDDNYESDTEEPTNTLQTCFKTMVDTLSKQDPETISQVQLLVKELRRITLLWDELWLGTFAQHQSEINKRQQQLEYEIEKVNENTSLDNEQKISLIAEKHRIVIKPIIFILEQLQDITSAEAETPHEKEFQEKYLDEIKDVIAKLKNPEHPEKPIESLQPLKLLQKKFQQKFHKRASYSLKMHDISPVLAEIRNTLIAMPGITTNNKNSVTISQVYNTVTILPTKTKPKKLVFYGSDGQTYTYLFKGLEDLHLDERIMQFLSIANTMMAQNSDPSDHNLFRARHYSVIPLGPRSGLISWVDGTTPAFALYKRWQQRELAKQNLKNNDKNVSTSVLRPSELFYNKLNPLLQEHGVKNIENRKEWPHSVLKQVLTELMAETPSDLLAKELWCNSISAGVWWQVVKRYSYSVAVMSIIGYIIGLGDRHLDNVLVDLTTGDVVHIDYNVCFEKGKTLRVPEKVPFRLTPNIREALGFTGVEGIFRQACENVLKTMQKGRETLLTLLEAFVYDPLIDWTVGGEVLAGTSFGGLTVNGNPRQSKKDLEREVTLSMFNVRCTEMSAEWNENKEELLSEIYKLEHNMINYCKSNKSIIKTENDLQDLHQQLALVKEAEAHGAHKHPLYSLPHHYDAYHKTQTSLNIAKSDVENILLDSETRINHYNKAMKTFEGDTLNSWARELTNNKDNLQIFDLVREFLHNAGKDDVILQCEKSEAEILELSKSLNESAKNCLQMLQKYNILLGSCPKSYVQDHRCKKFLKMCKILIANRTTEACDEVFEQFRSMVESNLSEHIFSLAYSLDALNKEALNQINKSYEDLAKISNEETLISLEKQYTQAKTNIATFLSCEKSASNSLEFVIAGELVLLNRNFITLEIAAHRSEKVLIKLQTREGDWFLDDLVLNSQRAVEMINNLPIQQNREDQRFFKVLNGVKIANNIYRGLYDLHSNFYNIILPECMKKVQSEESTVLEMIRDLNELILGIGMPIPDMIEQLNKFLKSILMQMDVHKSYDYIVEKVAVFRSKFQSLVGSQNDQLTQGNMLLMGFNGLFEKITQEMTNFVNLFNDLEIPKSWRKIDQVKEAKSISAHIFNADVRKILEDIFLLKRLQTMAEFFQISQEMCQSFNQHGNLRVYNDEQLVRPVRQFIADFISCQLLGVTTETIAYTVCFILQNLGLDVCNEIEQRDIGAESKVPMDEIYNKSWNRLVKEGVFTQNVLSQASSLENNLKNAWEKIQIPKKIEHKLSILQSTIVRIQNQLTIVDFMYDDIHGYNSIRNKLLEEMDKEVKTLQKLLARLSSVREVQQQLIDKAHQRLNWGKGANPNISEISSAFENAVISRDTVLSKEQNIATEVLIMCNSIFNYEILRSNNTINSNDYNKKFSRSFEKWRVACQYVNCKNDTLTHTEESIMNMLTPEIIKNPKWIQIISENLTDTITIFQKTLSDAKEDMCVEIQDIVSLLENFKALYSGHCKLMADVKSLIKIMSKIEDYSLQTQMFIADYKLYTDHFNALFVKLKKDVQKEDVDEAMEHLTYVKDHTVAIYDGLVNLQVKRGKPALVRQDCVSFSPKHLLPQKQESTTKGQIRNAYAVGVWRRVKMKLEGKDPDPGRKYTPQEQVDYVIREATSLDNLALLYEGWTPWV